MFATDHDKRHDTSESLKEVKLLEENLINDYKHDFNTPIDKKVISSMNCVLQCFFGLDNINMIKTFVNKKINNKSSFIFSFFNFVEIIEKYRNNSINNNDYNN